LKKLNKKDNQTIKRNEILYDIIIIGLYHRIINNILIIYLK